MTPPMHQLSASDFEWVGGVMTPPYERVSVKTAVSDLSDLRNIQAAPGSIRAKTG